MKKIFISLLLVFSVGESVYGSDKLKVSPFNVCNFEKEPIIGFQRVVNTTEKSVFYVLANGDNKLLFKSTNAKVKKLNGTFSRNIIEKKKLRPSDKIWTWVTVQEWFRDEAVTHLFYLPLRRELFPSDLGFSNNSTILDDISFEYVPSTDNKEWLLYIRQGKKTFKYPLLALEKKLLSQCGGFEALPESFDPNM